MLNSDSTQATADELFKIVKAMDNLRNLKVIRSQKIVSDFGEWMAATLLGGEIADSKIQKGWDIRCEGKRIQVRTHAKSETNKNKWSPVPKSPTQCDSLLIVILSDRLRIEKMIHVPIEEAIRNSKKNRLSWAKVEKHTLNPTDYPAYKLLSLLFAKDYM